MVSARHGIWVFHVVQTGIVSNAADVLGTSVVP